MDKNLMRIFIKKVFYFLLLMVFPFNNKVLDMGIDG